MTRITFRAAPAGQSRSNPNSHRGAGQTALSCSLPYANNSANCSAGTGRLIK